MGQFESLLWERRSRRIFHNRTQKVSARWDGNPLTEWTARPLGRLGRPLLVEVEAYLEFFAIARTEASTRTRP